MSSGPDAPARSAAAAAVRSVLGGLGELAAVESWAMSDDELAALVGGLEHVHRLATAQSMRLAAEADRRGLPAQTGHVRLEQWLRAQSPTLTPRAAAGLARRTERLFASTASAELRATRTALLAGA